MRAGTPVSTSTRSRAVVALAVAVTVLVATVVGVVLWRATAGEDTPRTGTAITAASATASPTPSVDPRQAEAITNVIAAYHGYQTAYTNAAAVPDPNYAELTRYIGDPFLTQVRTDLRLLATNGLVRQGPVKTDPKVTEVRIDATPPVATIQDCYDTSDVHVINKATGKSADAPGQPTRYVVTSQAKFYGEGRRWLIVQSEADRNRSC